MHAVSASPSTLPKEVAEGNESSHSTTSSPKAKTLEQTDADTNAVASSVLSARGKTPLLPGAPSRNVSEDEQRQNRPLRRGDASCSLTNSSKESSETKSFCHCLVALKDSALNGLTWVADSITNCVKAIFNAICGCCKKSTNEDSDIGPKPLTQYAEAKSREREPTDKRASRLQTGQ